MRSRRVALSLAAAFVGLTATAEAAEYRVDNVRTAAQRAAVARTGAAIVEVDHGSVVVTASKSDRRALRKAGFTLRSSARASDFPAADAAYHNYTEMTNEVMAVTAANPAIANRFSLGTSYEGRALWAAKISDNVGDRRERARGPVHLRPARPRAPHDRDVPVPAQRAHVEVRARDAQVANFVNSREIYIVFNVNPDGSEYDVATGTYRSWRKNRQPNGTGAVGTDLNRNWGWQWGCCGGSSGTFSSETYRGASAFSAPETQRVRDFVNSRVVGGAQQIKAHIDFHTYSELVLWPYGYTTANTGAGPDRDRPGRALAARPQHGRHQRLHARAGQRPLHRRRHDRRLGVGPAQDRQLHVRDVPAHVEPGLLSVRLADQPRGHPQPRRGHAAARRRGLPVRGDRRSRAGRSRRRSTATRSRPPPAGRPTPTPRPPAAGSARTRRHQLQRRQAARHDGQRLVRPRDRRDGRRRRRRQRHRRRPDVDPLPRDRAARRQPHAELQLLLRPRLQRDVARTTSACGSTGRSS